MHTSTPAQRARALWSVRALFANLGVVAGIWGVHIPTLKHTYALGEATLSVVLLAISAGAIAVLLLAGRVIGRFGVPRCAVVAAWLMGLALAVCLYWPGWLALLPSMVVMGGAMSLYDVAINTEGSALEALEARPVMSNLHGHFSLGGMVGAALGALLLALVWPATLQLALLGLVCGGVASLGVRHLLPHVPAAAPRTADADAPAPTPAFAWPRGPLLALGLLAFVAMAAEGALYDWSVLFLQQEVGVPQDRAALGYTVFAAAMALARFGGDALRHRVPEATLLRWGGGTAAVAMALVLLTGNLWVTLAGYALIGGGLALSAPVLYNAATHVPGTQRAAAIATVSSIGYFGFLVGPPLIGSLADAWGLTWALGVVVVGAGLMAWGARVVPDHAPRPQRRFRAPD